ncbi:class I SAM-dependent methyltransferase [Paenibacillus arenosi]|uniref:Class I SAM-dependent methyltransferase n=1 Tax=Paenibacillus arenosi TaxID=2774142 RepID=A0ABR9AV07_9BACL|nr:class I SAM-dependent methyltransferase [Paenibacillus arenosi]MBD8497957.1 class I SAM-dependent methyltransferase [Paenibacillus arenosi]
MAKFHGEYWNGYNLHAEEVDIEKDIQEYIKQTSDNDYSHIIKYDNRWLTFFHLTEMRKSLLNWYEFREDAELLEVGGGMGALTGLFCKRCAHVTTVEPSWFRAESINARYRDIENLDIYAGSIHDINFGKKFDYITVIGMPEYLNHDNCSGNPYVDYLKSLSQLLKPDGKLLIAIENKYGIKYWCGGREEHSGIPFEGINGYPNGGSVGGVGKKELEKILISSGLHRYKFYYPMPDFKVPQVVYSEKFLPQSGLQSRITPYYLDNSTLLASEMDLYDDLIDNGVFEFFSNSFLVECGFDENFCSVIYAATTTDRSAADRFCTTIHEGGIVKKMPLEIEGNTSVQHIYSNLMELQTRGIHIVPHKLENNKLVMPYVECESLEAYLKKIIRQDKGKFIALFDKLYACILKSSDWVDTEANFFYDSRNPELEYGPILQKAYIDLIPNNCFYCDGELVFFDQEFVKENYPAAFIMFRAIKYMYLFIPNADDSIPLEDMKIRYRLTEVWNVFENSDMDFVKENRNYSLYAHFQQWSYVDRKIISDNALKLMRSDEAELLLRRGYRRIAIYGYGHMGRKLHQKLKDSTIEVAYVIDQNADSIIQSSYTDIPIVHPAHPFAHVDAIVISVVSAAGDIQELLKKKVDYPVITLEEIAAKALP